MATSINYWTTYECHYKVRECVSGWEHLPSATSIEEGGDGGGGVTWETHNMEVKGQLISAPDPLKCQNRKQRAERMTELQERRRSLQTLLSTRLAELRRICLQEAGLTGEVPNDYPLEAGERPPYVRRRVGTSRHTSKGEEEESGQRTKSKKTLFSGALRRHTDSEHNTHHSKRTVHRGCHTDDTVKSESSSTSDSTGHDTDEVSRCRPLLLALGSPDGEMGRKLSPVEVYYEIKTRRNSLASSNNSPSRSLPRSVSNLEGRSVPATPLLSRNGPITAHIRAEHLEAHQNHKHFPHPHQPPPPPPHPHPQHLPHPQQPPPPSPHPQQPPPPPPPPHPQQPPPPPPHSHNSSSSSGPSELGGEPGLRCNVDRVGESGVSVNAARRSNSSDALLDHTIFSEEEGVPGQGQGGARGNGIPLSRGTNTAENYKSPETLTDGQGRMVNGHAEPGRRGEREAREKGRGGYSEILMEYVLGKQQKMQLQRQQSHGNPRQPIPVQHATHYSCCHNPPFPTPHIPGGQPAYPPLALRGQPGEPRRVKVTRTKSCGPFIPIQQNLADPSYTAFHLYPDSSPPPPPPHHHQQSDPHPPWQPPPRPAQEGHPEEATRSLHKALALEGLRDWYLRNTLGPNQNNTKVNAGVNAKVTGVNSGVKGQQNGERALQRRRTTHSGPTQLSAYQAETHHQYAPLHPQQVPHSATFHGHPLHASSLYQDSFPSQKQEMPLKEQTTDQPSPGTLV